MDLNIIGYFAATLMGLSLGMLGGGGSILTVPILVYLFKIDPIISTSYSLMVVGVTAFIGGYQYYKKNEIDVKTIFLFSLPGLIGVNLVRTFILPSLPSQIYLHNNLTLSKSSLIMISFSLIMFFASVSMIKKKKEINELKIKKNSSTIVLLIGLLVGLLSGFVGAGGGFIIIPALVMIVGLPMRKAIGTSLFIIAINSTFGLTGSFIKGNEFSIDWTFLSIILSISITGLYIGVTFSGKFSEILLKKLFGYFVFVMSLIIAFDQVIKLL